MMRSLVSSSVASTLACLLGAALLCAPGCSKDGEGMDTANDDADDDDDDDDDDATADTGTAGEGWIDIGYGQVEYSELSDGDTFEIVWGTQGSAMFPIMLRGGDFELPPDPGDWQHEAAPIVELWMDVEGHNDGFGGHFKRIANYPVGFEVLEDGTFQSTYIAIILPDDKTPEELDGLPATLWLELDPLDQDPIEVQLDLVVSMGEPPG